MMNLAPPPVPTYTPGTDLQEHLQRWRDCNRLSDEACNGYSDAVRAALIGCVCRVLPTTRARDLLTQPDHRLWNLGLAAYEADPTVLDQLPEAITTALTRGERIALSFGLKKKTATLPTGRDAIELGGAIFGPLVGEVLASITWPLAQRENQHRMPLLVDVHPVND